MHRYNMSRRVSSNAPSNIGITFCENNLIIVSWNLLTSIQSTITRKTFHVEINSNKISRTNSLLWIPEICPIVIEDVVTRHEKNRPSVNSFISRRYTMALETYSSNSPSYFFTEHRTELTPYRITSNEIRQKLTISQARQLYGINSQKTACDE